jgi:hypothetical protein
MTSVHRTGIFNLLKTVTGLSASTVGYQTVPRDTSGTYCIFNSVNHPTKIDSVVRFEIDYVQFDVVGVTLSSVESVVADLKSKFDFGALTIVGYSVNEMRRINVRTSPPEDGTHLIQLEYKLTTEISR